MEDNHRQRPGERRPVGRRRQGFSIRLVGHKGADAILPGNTLESFEAAISEGVHAIEFDVLWLEDGHPNPRPHSAHRWSSPTTGTTPAGVGR